MTSNRRQNTTFSDEEDVNLPTETSARKIQEVQASYENFYGHLGPTTSVIYASESWWKDREVDRIVKSFKRKPPEHWDVMQRCFILYDVQSQSQYSLHQRREELTNDGQNNDEDHLHSKTYGGGMQHTQVPETQENEEVNRIYIDDDMHPSNQFIQ
ncbi:Uncharacterized protein Rs2_38932 [Raphanus sativus]|nr:Uncharacterized protein Rs2_38932 [Raphanus sativus]